MVPSKYRNWIVALACLFPLSGCGGNADSNKAEPARPTKPPSKYTTPKDTVIRNDNVFNVKFETSAGDFVVEVHKDWAPLGAVQFRDLVESGYFNGCRFFRVIPDFMVQFGIHGDPAVSAKWREKTIADDPVTQSNTRGMVTFATAGSNTRTTQIFINFKNNSFLDSQGFSPFGKVTQGMEVVDAINAEYGERPDQGRIQMQGNDFLAKNFPNLDFCKKASIVE